MKNESANKIPVGRIAPRAPSEGSEPSHRAIIHTPSPDLERRRKEIVHRQKNPPAMPFVVLFILSLLIASAHAGPATVTGTARNSYGQTISTNVFINPISTPTVYATNTITSAPTNVWSDANGNYSVPLYPGDYSVLIGNLKRDTFIISVTNGDTTYRIENIINTSLTYTSTLPPVYELKSNKGQANGYAALGGDGLVQPSQIGGNLTLDAMTLSGATTPELNLLFVAATADFTTGEDIVCTNVDSSTVTLYMSTNWVGPLSNWTQLPEVAQQQPLGGSGLVKNAWKITNAAHLPSGTNLLYYIAVSSTTNSLRMYFPFLSLTNNHDSTYSQNFVFGITDPNGGWPAGYITRDGEGNMGFYDGGKRLRMSVLRDARAVAFYGDATSTDLRNNITGHAPPIVMTIDVAGNVTATSFVGNATTATTATSATSFSGPLTGDVTGTQGATVNTSVAHVTSGVLGAANGGTGNTTGQPSGTAGGFLAGSYPNPTLNGGAALPTAQLSGTVGNGNLPSDLLRSNTANQTIFQPINAVGGFANIGSWTAMTTSTGAGGGNENQPIWIFGGNTNFTGPSYTSADFGPQMASLGPRSEFSFALLTTNASRGGTTIPAHDIYGKQLYAIYNWGSIGVENDTSNAVAGNAKGVFSIVDNGNGFAIAQSVAVGGVSGNYEHMFVSNGLTHFTLFQAGNLGAGYTNAYLDALVITNDGTASGAGGVGIYSNLVVGGGMIYAGPFHTALTRYDTASATSYLNGADNDPTSTVQATNFVSTVPYGAAVQFQNNGCQFRSSDGKLQLGTTSGQEPFIGNTSGYLLTISEGGDYGAMRIQQNNIHFGWLNDAGGNIGSSVGGGYAKRPGNVYLKSFLEFGNSTTGPTAADIGAGGTGLWSSNGTFYASCTANGTTLLTTQLATHP